MLQKKKKRTHEQNVENLEETPLLHKKNFPKGLILISFR